MNSCALRDLWNLNGQRDILEGLPALDRGLDSMTSEVASQSQILQFYGSGI